MALTAKIAVLLLAATAATALPVRRPLPLKRAGAVPADVPTPLKCAAWAGKELCAPGAITTLSVNQYGGGGKRPGSPCKPLSSLN